MRLFEQPRATGQLAITITRGEGTVETVTHENLVVDLGLNHIVRRLRDSADAPMSHMAVGAGLLAADAADSALGTELGRAPIASAVINGNQIVYNASFGPGVGTGAITESGIFNDPAVGTMLCRTVFPVINKQIPDSIALTWTLTISPKTYPVP